MKVAEILNQIEQAQGTNAKLAILQTHKNNDTLKRVLEYGLDSFKQFNVVKVPKVERKLWDVLGAKTDDEQWHKFFVIADQCASREITGNKAIYAMHSIFSLSEDGAEKWMRKILQKNFKIGANLKTIGKVFPGIVKTFEVQLAEKWNEKSFESLPLKIRIEPKLDGIRLVSIVKEGACEMFSRGGKVITNFDSTIGNELRSLPDGVYDGEVMDDDFTSLMRQVHRKEDANVSKSYLALFDFIPLEEWSSRDSKISLSERRMRLEAHVQGKSFQYIRLVEHLEIDRGREVLDLYHKKYVDLGFEGAMVKNPKLPYCFGRSDAVIKVKSFDEADLKVTGFKEGTGKHEGILGAILVDHNGIEVKVGSGFDEETRAEVWANKDKYLGMIAEVRYQEITPDGSLRFPTFVCWRLDK
jgi:DNA ligase-1